MDKVTTLELRAILNCFVDRSLKFKLIDIERPLELYKSINFDDPGALNDWVKSRSRTVIFKYTYSFYVRILHINGRKTILHQVTI